MCCYGVSVIELVDELMTILMVTANDFVHYSHQNELDFIFLFFYDLEYAVSCYCKVFVVDCGPVHSLRRRSCA